MRRPPLILTYHSVRNIDPEMDPEHLVTPPSVFQKHVRSLKRRGYHFVKVAEFGKRLRNGGSLKGLCALTFDDGTLDNLEVLPGILKSYGIPATSFVCPGLLGRPHPDFPQESGVRLMSAPELRELAALDFIEIGSHTRFHTDLGEATEHEAFEEMDASKRELEELTGKPVLSFAYPKCHYSPACVQAAERAGYTTAVTCWMLGGWRPYELYRENIDSMDGRLSFAIKSRGLWEPIFKSPPGRLARRLARSRRHAEE